MSSSPRLLSPQEIRRVAAGAPSIEIGGPHPLPPPPELEPLPLPGSGNQPRELDAVTP